MNARISEGFTLLEMLVVLMIMAVVVAIALPNLMRSSEGFRLRAATQSLLGALRATRAAAIARNIPMAVEIDVDSHTFRSPVVPAQSFSADITAKLTVAEPVRSGRSRGGFLFFPDGSSTGGDVTLLMRDNAANICVNWLTGEAQEGAECKKGL
jgi:general secretion pathway protein H